jgi:hypothetical protein
MLETNNNLQPNQQEQPKERIATVGYGHLGKTESYEYLDNGDHRTQQNVVGGVTSKKGKQYNTLTLIKRIEQKPVGYAQAHGLKTLGGESARTLPGFQTDKKTDPTLTLKRWGEQRHIELRDKSAEVDLRKAVRNSSNTYGGDRNEWYKLISKLRGGAK